MKANLIFYIIQVDNYLYLLGDKYIYHNKKHIPFNLLQLYTFKNADFEYNILIRNVKNLIYLEYKSSSKLTQVLLEKGVKQTIFDIDNINIKGGELKLTTKNNYKLTITEDFFEGYEHWSLELYNQESKTKEFKSLTSYSPSDIENRNVIFKSEELADKNDTLPPKAKEFTKRNNSSSCMTIILGAIGFILLSWLINWIIG